MYTSANIDRKLTSLEKRAAEKYYYLLSVYMNKRGLNEAEWRSNLHLPYIKGIQKYYENEKLHVYNITTIIWKKLENCYSNYCRDLKRQKRNPEGGIYSYESLAGNMLHFDILQDGSSNAYKFFEREIISKIMIETILGEINEEKRRNIVNLFSLGLKKADVKRFMDCSNYELMKNIKEIKKVIIDLYKE